MSLQKFKTRSLKKEFITPRTNDDVHRSIKLCPLTKEIMSTPQMQRLRNLKQLGVSDIVYPTANHTRFQHSLGVTHLAEQLLREINDRQPKLGITEKDIACVKIAGLLHDIGHGPFSHVYDGPFRDQLKQAEKKGVWLGQKFDTTLYKDLPDVMDGWAHEDASLMMIDAMLKELGLEVDESNLDAPLKQIGDGIDARGFGIWDRSSEPDITIANSDDSDDELDIDEDDADLQPLPLDKVLTSRDWIFIKECIVGGPLPPKGMSIDNFKKSGQNVEVNGRPNPHKEFLYDVVANRHSGLDVDKMDYLARDTLRANSTNLIVDLLPKMMEKAFVAWGECSNPQKCWKCRNKKHAADGKSGLHTMICYPDNMVENAMAFFEQRYREHQRLYQHHKTSRGNYMICDILLLAEQFFRIHDGRNMKLPISRAMVNAETYLALNDSILDQIRNTDSADLEPARTLIKEFQGHQIYPRIANQPIGDKPWQQKLWNMEEADVTNEILKLSEVDMSDNALVEDDIIVEKMKIHHGMSSKNPVNFMRFLPKKLQRQLTNSPESLPIARQIADSSYEYRKPDIFLQRSVRVFCRSSDSAMQKQLGKCFKRFIGQLEDEAALEAAPAFEVEEYIPQSPRFSGGNFISQTQSPPTVSRTPDRYDGISPPNIKRQKCDDPKTLFQHVTQG